VKRWKAALPAEAGEPRTVFPAGLTAGRDIPISAGLEASAFA